MDVFEKIGWIISHWWLFAGLVLFVWLRGWRLIAALLRIRKGWVEEARRMDEERG